MKLLLFTHIFPYPLTEGGKVAQFGVLEYLCSKNEVVLVCEKNYEGISDDAEKLNAILPALKIKLLVAKQTEKPKGLAAGALDKVNKLQWRLQKEVNKSQPAANSLVLESPVFIYPTRPRQAPIINQLIQVVNEEQPDLVQVDFIDNADIVNAIPQGIKKVLVHHDLRYASVLQACHLQHESNAFADYLSGYVKTVETAFLNKFDGVITFSKEDKVKLLDAGVSTRIESIPFATAQKNIADLDAANYSIEKLVFIGPHYHLPNFDAVKWYATEMALAVWNKHGLKLTVIGNWSAGAIEQLPNNELLHFAGYVDDLKVATANALMLSPLRIGSGIRTKLLDAFTYGIPVIATSLGCEGLGAQHEEEIMIADNAEAFLSSIERLMNNNELLRKIRSGAHGLIKESYSQERVGAQRMEMYKKVANKKPVEA